MCGCDGGIERSASLKSMMNQMLTLDISSQYGSCMPLSNMRIGMHIHNVELRPGQGGKLVRAAGTSARILTEPNRSVGYCEIVLLSGEKRLIDKRCRATIGAVSNPEHGTKKLRKAGQSRWLGIRPTVRGVAMNPVDHPHGGGEGKSKSSGKHGHCSRTPWGKPTKSGYKTARTKKRDVAPGKVEREAEVRQTKAEVKPIATKEMHVVAE
ncbi:60S ribosomal protein L2, mitochondrial-like [Salvia splendens]|uniref:60S ribosomal protein L2, mitochondrial-like n=1 Tax=Salvia splendens TaxID=180675 RepID=UPI001C2551D4|nr:60S ribosomal protein L2, mitochondrial-like [Salvia splendens]XP_041993871.1 60S ribosomal protein L2, mitochondrial-like [Salvia splendens]